MYHSGNPQPSARQGCRPLSETIHSEHILKERSDAQNVVSRFPCGNTTRRRQAATTFGPEARQPSHRRCVQERSRIRGSRAAANHQNANQALWHRKVNLAHRHPSLPNVLRPAFRPGGDVRRDLHPARPVLPPDGPLFRRQSHDGSLHRARLQHAAPAGLAPL